MLPEYAVKIIKRTDVDTVKTTIEPGLTRADLERWVADFGRRIVDQHEALSDLDAFSGDVREALDQNMALVTRGYEAGERDFLELLLMRRELLEARREHIDALLELSSAEAQLDRVLGVTPGARRPHPQ